MKGMEEGHEDWAEIQRTQIEQTGLQNYLTNQTDAKGTTGYKREPQAPIAEPAKPPRFVDVMEQKRLNDAREAGIPWKKWGPYLSERQWGTVREDPT